MKKIIISLLIITILLSGCSSFKEGFEDGYNSVTESNSEIE